ncbi:MAG: hypothetical protein CVT59_00135 [Actinobacteria bacterium HGW-Actinobacteria-1]|jgi:fucose 4-O-acetylase-like acetyltransferase|nr:MAG: hypothetical protein CVT59_00135 [Actinobacteria bacterium HGW-Actinobacteria-1]
MEDVVLTLAPQPRRPRLPWLDVLKGVAMAFVVINHAMIWPLRTGDGLTAFAYGTCYWTVAGFAAVTGYLAASKSMADPVGFLRRRGRQLLGPWALAAPVYALAPFVLPLLGLPFPIELDRVPWVISILLGGGALWFLPVLYAASVIATLLAQRTTSWWPFWVSLGVYAATAALVRESPLAFGHGTFWAVTPLYVASYWFGLEVAWGWRLRWNHATWLCLFVASLALPGLTSYLRTTLAMPWLAWLTYAAGVPGGVSALMLALGTTREPGVVSRAFARLGVDSLGVYVLHPLVLGPLMVVLPGARTLSGAFVGGSVAISACYAMVHLYRTKRLKPRADSMNIPG